MSIFKWIYERFNPPKTDDQIYREQAWNNLKYRQSPEGKRQAEIEKDIRDIEKKYIDDINPWGFG